MHSNWKNPLITRMLVYFTHLEWPWTMVSGGRIHQVNFKQSNLLDKSSISVIFHTTCKFHRVHIHKLAPWTQNIPFKYFFFFSFIFSSSDHAWLCLMNRKLGQLYSIHIYISVPACCSIKKHLYLSRPRRSFRQNEVYKLQIFVENQKSQSCKNKSVGKKKQEEMTMIQMKLALTQREEVKRAQERTFDIAIALLRVKQACA